MPTHTSKTNSSSLKLYKHRAEKVDLIWCNQVTTIIENMFPQEHISLNDIGCNYGQLFKEIKRKGLSDTFDYFGYDIDEIYLNMAKSYFPEIVTRLNQLDIEEEMPNERDITICSATFEHLDNPEKSLKNMLLSTSKTMILRTFVGNKTIKFVQEDSKFVENPYNINQFNLFDVGQIFMEHGFDFCCFKDKATGSIPYEVGESSGVFRNMFVIVGTKENPLRKHP